MRTLRLLLAAVLVPLLAACGASSSTSVTAPSGARCSVSVQAPQNTVAAGGGTGTVSVDTARECQWTATPDVPWLSVMSGGTGQGAGSLTFSAAANTSASTRVGRIDVNGQRIEITQEAAACDYAVAPEAVTSGAAGGNVRITVTTAPSCAWTAVSRASWIVVSAPANGTGSAEITVRTTTNTGAARSGTVEVGGRTVVVSQDAGTGCTFAIAPSSLSAGATGQSATVTVTAPASCVWSATSDSSWISVNGSGEGTGTGTIALVVAANSGAARNGTVTIAGQPFAVNQAAATGTPCAFTVSPLSVPIAAGGGSATLTITNNQGCSWNVSGAPAWISISPASGAGSGTVTLTVSPNTGAARTATLTAAGQTVTVTQAAPTATTCTYAINPTSFNPSAAAGSTTVAVTASAGCAWSTTGAPAWVTVTGGSGTGNGTVTIAVQANTGAARAATLTIAGQSFTLNQAAAAGTSCNYSLNPTSFSAPTQGGSKKIDVSTSNGCAWSTTGVPAWITVTGGTGTGNGSLNIAVQANTGAPRTATLTIAGQSFQVDQAADCNYAINPTTYAPTAAGGSTQVAVTTFAGCTWTTSGLPAWISASGGSGTGNGTVTLTVQANTGAARSDTLTIAGVSFTVNQAAAPCTYTVAPTTLQVPDASSTQTINVTTAGYCTWTAAVTTGGSWLTVTSGANDMGNGSVKVSVDRNQGSARTGTLTIAGKVVTINQDAK